MANTLTFSSFIGWIKDHKLFHRFMLAAMLLCMGYYVLEQINQRNEFADFRVYYDAASALRKGNQVYHLAFGVSSGFYKYSPTACIPFLPFTYLPFHIAAGLYYFLVSLLVVSFFLYMVFLLDRNIPNKKGKGGLLWTLGISVVFGADHIERELHLGNVNMLLMFMAIALLMAWYQKRAMLAGVLLGVILLFKPHFLIIIPYAVMLGQWRSLMAAASVLILGGVCMIPVLGIHHNMELFAEWFQAMGAHNVKLETSPNTIYGLVNNGFFGGLMPSFGIVIILGLIALAFLGWMKWLRIRNGKGIDGLEFAVLLALIPTLSHTDTEHFMFSFPCIVYVVYMLIQRQVKSNKWTVIGLLVVAFVPYCLNSPELVGRKMRFFFDEMGGIGIANLLIIAAAVMVKTQHPSSLRVNVG